MNAADLIGWSDKVGFLEKGHYVNPIERTRHNEN